MNDITILSEWAALSSLSVIIIVIGIIVFVAFAIVALSILIEDIDENWLCISVCLAVVGAAMVILGLFLPKDHGYKIMLNDNAKFSEVVEHYNVIETDGLILKVTEKTEDVASGRHN